MISQSLHDWLQTPLGAYLLAQERRWLDEVTPDIFGYHAIQLGLPKFDLLRESRIVHRVIVAPESLGQPNSNYVQAQFHELPFDALSVDLCLMPHVLEFSENPHEVLREIDRVLRPEGRVLVLGFNPWSLFGTRKVWASKGFPWKGQFVSLVRIKDWLQLLGLEPASGRLACYIPPCETEKWQRRFGFMEPVGDRWWGVAGGVYMLEAIKRVQGMRLIAPPWRDRQVKDRKFATVARFERLQREVQTTDIARDPENAGRLRLVK
jgi:SAM-dependent methyltransferase